MRLDTICIIVAAGQGRRMGLQNKKQFLEIEEKPILAHTIDVFEKNKNIDKILLVVSDEDIKYVKNRIVNRFSYKKIMDVISGGKTRQESVYKGIISVGECKTLMIHDGVRPFVTDDIINNSIDDSIKYLASVVGVKEKNTIKTKDDEGFVKETLNRKEVISVQTPQTFDYNTIYKAYKNAFSKGIVATDDSSLVEIMNVKVKITLGSYENIKITTLEDLITANQIVKSRRNFKK